MGFGETMIFYLVIGAGVALAVYLGDTGEGAGGRGLRAAISIVFWPLYVPVLLAVRGQEPEPAPAPAPSQADEMAHAISQVESELDAAFSSLDGWAEHLLAREAERIRELRTVWTFQAERIREMDRLLAQWAKDAPGGGRMGTPNDRLAQSENSRRENLRRLENVRDRAHDDLMGTLAWVRELVSMIHLAKFTGAPASRAEELVSQIAAAVEGVSAVTWQEESSVLTPASRATSSLIPSLQERS
jgi:hypothetical protein